MPNLVGIGLSQVPTNSMLGGMAYQDPDRVKIKKLNVDEISQINSEIANTAVDIFIYDTTKDSDGGAWRKRTSNTSWYNETLGTATRGTRREFPAVAVIVVETNHVTIYDGDDPNLPMWMVFNAYSTSSSYPGPASIIGWSTSGTVTMTCVSAKNGVLVFGSQGGTVEAFLIKDNFRICYGTTGWEIDGGWSILKRNLKPANFHSGTSFNLLSATVNALEMAVLPNAPIDSDTGLPIPTIFVGTEGGLNILKEDGTVLDGTSASGDNYERVQQITITDENYLWWTADLVFNSSYRRDSYTLSLDNLTSVEGNFTWNNSTDNLSVGPSYSVSTGGESGKIQIGNSNTWAFNHLARNALGGGAGLAIHKPNIGSETNSLFALITSDYNSGWMHGSCRGAFLADTDTTNKTNGQTDPDRSQYNYALSVTGTINKSAVATGADLVGYHGFSSSNYLRHTNGINYGNAATITMGGWSKIPGSSVDSNYRYLCSCRSGTIQIGLAIHIDQNNNSNAGKPYFYDVTNSSLQSTGPRVDDNEWHHILGVLDGGSKKIYIDGELIVSATVTGINLSAVDITNVGHYVASSGTNVEYSHGGYLALIKFSTSAATAEQVKKMYDDEKHLFEENAKATLHGTSNTVTGLAYDEKTDRYHVGTSWGRSDFQGLRRINNSTTAVTTAISAHDGFIVEQ